MLRVTFLGTAAARPTVGRNVSSVAVDREGELMLFDCGEGTQRQMMRYGTGFTVGDIFFTHVHADHILGLTGLLLTMALQGREQQIRLWGPPGSTQTINDAVRLGMERLPFAATVRELRPDERVTRDEYDIVAYRTKHGMNAIGYALIEHERLGRFDLERAKALGVPAGPMYGRLHRGEDVVVDGRVVRAIEVVGPPRPGRKLVYTGDTRPCAATVNIGREADLLIHDATFATDESERAQATGHSTAREAADVARRACAERLVLTHISARYADDARVLEREARRVFAKSLVAYDGLELEIGFRDAADEVPTALQAES